MSMLTPFQGGRPPRCKFCGEFDCYNGECFCVACNREPDRCTLCKGCNKCANGKCICEKLARKKAEKEAAAKKREDDIKRKEIQKAEAIKEQEMKREAVVVDTEAYRRIKKEYVAMQADLVAMKEEMKASFTTKEEEIAAINEENKALREELVLLNAKIERSSNKRPRPEEENGASSSSSTETNETKQCNSCSEYRPLDSFGKPGFRRKLCGPCRGTQYRAHKKACTTK